MVPFNFGLNRGRLDIPSEQSGDQNSGGRGWLTWLLIALPVIAVVSVTMWLLAPLRAEKFSGYEQESPQPAPDFALLTADGERFRLSEQRGKVNLLFFGYTHCPDVCPATLTTYERVAAGLSESEKRQVNLVFVTVDPERDTPERLRAYLSRYGEQVIGLTGARADLEPVWAAYQVWPERVEAEHGGDYTMVHPSQVYLIDPAGRLRLLYRFGTTEEAILHDVRLILAREAGVQGVRVSDAWVRAAAQGDVTAAYFTLENPGRLAETLAGMSSPAAERVELHRTAITGETARMEPVGAIQIPAGDRIAAVPGGLHAMVIGLRQPLRPGERVTLQFRFTQTGTIHVDAEVR